MEALKQSIASPCWKLLVIACPLLPALAMHLGVCSEDARTTLAPMLVCPLPSHGMDAETGICGGAKGTELDWAMLV